MQESLTFSSKVRSSLTWEEQHACIFLPLVWPDIPTPHARNSECISPTCSTGKMGLFSKGGEGGCLQNLGPRRTSVHERAYVYVGWVHGEKVRNEPTSSLRRRREQRRGGVLWVASCINTGYSKAHSQTYLCATITYILQRLWHLTLLHKQKKNCGLPQLIQIEKKMDFSVTTLRLQNSSALFLHLRSNVRAKQ